MNDDYYNQILSLIANKAGTAYGGQPLPAMPEEKITAPADGFDRFTTNLTGIEDAPGANKEFWRGMMQMGLGAMSAAGKPGANILSAFGEGGSQAMEALEKRRMERDHTKRERKKDLLEGYKTIFGIDKDVKESKLRETQINNTDRHQRAMEGIYSTLNEYKMKNKGGKVPSAIPLNVRDQYDSYLENQLEEGVNVDEETKQAFRERANNLYQQTRNPDEAMRLAYEELKPLLKKQPSSRSWYNPARWFEDETVGIGNKVGAAAPAAAPAAASPVGRVHINPKTGEKIMFDGTAWVPAP